MSNPFQPYRSVAASTRTTKAKTKKAKSKTARARKAHDTHVRRGGSTRTVNAPKAW